MQWAGLDPNDLDAIGGVRVAGQRLPLLDANVWLHSNRAGYRDEFADKLPFCIQLDSGIAIYRTGATTAPRLPLLGLRGLCRAELQLRVDCQKCRVSLRTPRQFWLF